MLTIYKASAGSGKTFRLVTEYLKLILENENNYKHILAVTFTNKATGEMKERVVKQLYNLSKGNFNKYTSILIAETGYNREQIIQKARKALRNILHDYSRFSVSTIDKFTQRVLKAFNREIGISPGYIIELDNDLIIQEAVDRLSLKINDKPGLLTWLFQLGEERIRKGKGYSINQEIVLLGKELFKEHFQEIFSGKNKELYSRENLKKYQAELQKIIFSFENYFKKQGKKSIDLIKENGFTVDDFIQKKRGPAGFLESIASGNYNKINRYVLEAIEGPENWYLKSNKNIDCQKIHSLVEKKLHPILTDTVAYINKNENKYFTAKIILNNLYTLGILNDLQDEINEIRHEKGILPISDSNLLLNKIIGESDSPFIYEKIGNVYKHFMLDEFQDTSGLQWKNIKPMVLNSLSEGKNNLIVGDVKQSIYRWRNSNWNILAESIENDFENYPKTIEGLKCNYRSFKNIVQFNNHFFPQLIRLVSREFESNETINAESLKFEKIYRDIDQEYDSDRDGYLKMSMINEEDQQIFKEISVSQLVDQIKELQEKGYQNQDIAILVRKNEEGAQIINQMLKASADPKYANVNLNVVSNESLFLNSSISVLFIICIIAHLIDPDDSIIKANLLEDYTFYIYPSLNLKENDNLKNLPKPEFDQLGLDFQEKFQKLFDPIIKKLKNSIINSSVDEVINKICNLFNLYSVKEDLPYIQSLSDQAVILKNRIGNGLTGFLKWWEEKGYKVTVNVNEKADAIRLFTVHRAKGLEFQIVLLPFLNWPLLWQGNQTPTIWCQPQEKPFNNLPLVPVKAVKDLSKSIFIDQYSKEIFNTYVDCINLVYVAFTRAKEILIIHSQKNENKSGTINNLFNEIIHSFPESMNQIGLHKTSDDIFEIGELKHNIDLTESNEQSFIPEKFHSYDYQLKLRIRKKSDSYFSMEKKRTNKNLGILLHEILSGIIVKEDADRVCKQALLQRLIDHDEYKILLSWLHDLMESEHAKEWFSGKYKVLNERALLSFEKNIRPDRIMIHQQNVVVIDYKLDKSSTKSYQNQIKTYINALYDSGYIKVEGYLWYLKPNIIEKVVV